jgi:uncharacterized protein (TIGR01777 family)
MQIAVTGSHGLIGTALCTALTDGGHDVIRVVRGDATGDDRTIRWDPAAGTIDAAALEGVDAVVHLAGESIASGRWTDARKRTILESRTVGTRTLADALASLSSPPKVFLSGSAIGFYGDRGDEELTEDSAPGSGFLTDVVLAWEDAAQPAVDAGIRTVSLRTGIVLDAHDGALPRMAMPVRFGVGGKLGSGAQWMSWITLADEVGAIVHLLDADVAGPVNLTAPNPVTNATLTKALGEVLHRPTVLAVPAFALRTLLGRELADELLLGGQRVLPTKLLASGYAFRDAEIVPALRSVFDRPAA